MVSVDLDNETHYALSVYKLQHRCKTLNDALKHMQRRFNDAD